MSSPRSGFRRVAVASWALAGLGAAGVAGASALAYGDTVKPAQPVEDVVAVEQPVIPAVVAPTTAELPPPPPVAAQPTFQPAPTQAYTPTYTAPTQQQQYNQAPAQTYAPAQTQAPAQAPAAASGPIGGSTSSTKSPSSSSSSSSSSATKHIPMGASGGANKAVPHTIAHGS